MAVKRFSNSLISQSGQDKVNNFIAGYSPAIDEMDLIERVTVGSGGTSSITFSNIPQTYQHLQVRFVLRNTWGINQREEVRLRFNSDTGSNYARHGLEGEGSVASAFGAASQTSMGAGVLGGDALTASIFSVGIIDVLDYASTSKAKPMRSLTGVDANGSGWLWMRSGLWTSTNAITTITLSSDNGQNLKQYSCASLYGVKA